MFYVYDVAILLIVFGLVAEAQLQTNVSKLRHKGSISQRAGAGRLQRRRSSQTSSSPRSISEVALWAGQGFLSLSLCVVFFDFDRD